MKKIISGILTAAMLLGMLTFGGVAADVDHVLKFDDTELKDANGAIGGKFGYGHYSPSEGDTDLLAEALDGNGFALSMDFTLGRPAPCSHPVEPGLYHSSKFHFTIGSCDGANFFFGYNATRDEFYFAVSGNGVLDGEGVEGNDYDYLATSEHGLVNYGVEYNVVFIIDFQFDLRVFLDGELIISYNLYDDTELEWSYEKIFFIPTHISFYLDDLAVYKYGTYDLETGELTGEPVAFDDFENIGTEERDVLDAEGNPTGEKETIVVNDGWSFLLGSEFAYSSAVLADEIYGQPNYNPGDAPNLIFTNDVDSSSSRDFTVDLTMKNNTGINKLELDLMSDPYITPVSVEAADGYTATLNGSKLTITGSNCKNEDVATITYHMSEEAVQNFWYGYGAKVGTQKGEGGAGMDSFVITNGMTQVYNYTVGDVNGDGKMNLVDAGMILKFNAKWDLPGVFKESMEVNGDGRVNNMDVSYYMRHLAGWKDYEMMPKPAV